MLESNQPAVRYPKPETLLESDPLYSLTGSRLNLLGQGKLWNFEPELLDRSPTVGLEVVVHWWDWKASNLHLAD